MEHRTYKTQIAAALACCLLLSGCGAGTRAIPDLADNACDAGDLAPETVEAAQIPAPAETPETEPSETEAPETEPPASEAEAPEGTEAPETTEAPVDTEAPFFLYLVSSVTVDRGKEFDLHKYISYIDDLDPEVALSVEGSVDAEANGDYLLSLRLEDDAGNAATARITVKVTDPANAPSSYTPLQSKSFDEFAERYRQDGAMVGIDVSKWQAGIDFQQVAAAGCEFVIIRIGGCTDEPFEDAYYKDNLRNAKAAGLKVGVYWYSQEDGPERVRENADYLYSLLDGEELDFPIFFDWEDFTHFENYKMSMRDLNEMFLAFRDEAEAHGYTAALYNSKNFLNKVWSEEVKACGVWLAHYTEKTDYDGSYFLWQQGLARIDGIRGDVDVDVFYPGALS